MADRFFERVLTQSAAGVQAQQGREDPEQRKRKAQARRLPAAAAANCCRLAPSSVWHPPPAALYAQYSTHSTHDARMRCLLRPAAGQRRG